MDEPTVADELAYDALPEETRAMIERVATIRTDDALERAFKRGHRAGYRKAMRDLANKTG